MVSKGGDMAGVGRKTRRTANRAKRLGFCLSFQPPEEDLSGGGLGRGTTGRRRRTGFGRSGRRRAARVVGSRRRVADVKR